MLVNTSYTFLGDSTSGVAAHGTTTDIDFKIAGSYMVFAVEVIYSNAADGDYAAFQVVDKDNVLGYGAGLVLAEWVKKWYVPSALSVWKTSSEMVTQLPPGLYARLRYTSVGTENDVPIKINYSMIWP